MLMFVLYAVLIYFALAGLWHIYFYRKYLGPAIKMLIAYDEKKRAA